MEEDVRKQWGVVYLIGPDPVTTMDLVQRAQGIPANFQYEVKDGQVPQVVINTRLDGSYNNHVVFAREALDEERQSIVPERWADWERRLRAPVGAMIVLYWPLYDKPEWWMSFSGSIVNHLCRRIRLKPESYSFIYDFHQNKIFEPGFPNWSQFARPVELDY